MARKKNENGTIQITISTTPRNCEILDWLSGLGPYGKNRADAAERIVSERLREFLEEEKFRRKESGE